MGNESRVDWKHFGAFVVGAATVAGVLFAGISAWDSHRKNEEDKAQEAASIVIPDQEPIPDDGVIPAAEYIPWGNQLPTLLPFRNDGKREALVKQVILSDWKWIRTPRRRPITGAGKTIRITFERRHYVPETSQYMLVLREPAAVPGGGQWTTLEVSLVDPRLAGQTFVGTVTIIFDGLEQKHFKDVQLDVLRDASEQP